MSVLPEFIDGEAYWIHLLPPGKTGWQIVQCYISKLDTTPTFLWPGSDDTPLYQQDFDCAIHVPLPDND
jgi:hypothetical protein